MSQQNSSNNLFAFFAVIAVLCVGGFFIISNLPNNKENTVSSSSSSVSLASVSSVPSQSSASVSSVTSSSQTATTLYKNGSYSATSKYEQPEGYQSLTVNLKVENDAITEVSTTTAGGDRTSQRYVQLFNEGISTKVVGKKLNQISSAEVGYVNGASLTGEGFLSALKLIQQQAKS